MKFLVLLVLYMILCPEGHNYAQMHLDWARLYSGITGYEEVARSIAIDDSGNVFITGGSALGGVSEFKCVTIKYNKFGDSLWNRQYKISRNTQGYDIEVDDSGFVYVSGTAILKYNRFGDLIWSKYDSTGYYKIILDSNGNIYGGAVHLGQLIVSKYDRNSTRIWSRLYSFPGNAGSDQFGDLAMDKSGNIIITGRSKSTITNYDFATVKYSNNGNLIWSRRYSGPVSYSVDGAHGITTDNSYNIYVTGSAMDSANIIRCHTIKYDSAGNVLWNKRFESINSGYNILTDSSQNVFIACQTGGRTSLVKLDIDGNIIWYRAYPEGDIFVDNYPVIVLDSAYNIYVTANSTATGANDYAALKYDSSGNQIYVVTYNYNSLAYDYAYDIAVDKKGCVYLTGEFSATTGNYGTVKFSPLPTIISNSSFFPEKYELGQNYPNPFNGNTIINYILLVTSFVRLKIYDVLGNEVATLVNEKKNAGVYEVEFDASDARKENDLSSGIYFYRLETNGNIIDTKRMVLLK